MIPTQMSDADEAEKINNAGAHGNNILTSSMGTKFTMSFFLGKAIDEIWSVLNSLQIV